MKPVIAITPGEPAGIGPDICIQYCHQQAFEQEASHHLVLIADPELIKSRAQLLGLDVQIEEINLQDIKLPLANKSNKKNIINILPVALSQASQCGELNQANANYVLETLRIACEGCLKGELHALVTGPVQKSIINDAGFTFTGHTEYLANLCQQETVVMMLATEGLRVALATTHLPLTDVPKAITKALLRKVIAILHADLVNKFGIVNPNILVTGLNPHAGENGHLGREEIEIISPVIAEFVNQGMLLQGPMPADTLFTEKNLKQADAVLAMYHDQGLPVLKYKGFGKAVNITLGLPIIRTSVDHGTALDLAGSGKADIGSLTTAIDYAKQMSFTKINQASKI